MSSLPRSLQLYRNIRRLHRQMPIELGKLGNDYIKSEFQRHRGCDDATLKTFLREWTYYYTSMARQVEQMNEINTSIGIPFGQRLQNTHLDNLNDGQLGQLFALKEAIKTGDTAGTTHSDEDPNLNVASSSTTTKPPRRT